MQRAFSLVELSIVLVILGLLTGGILAGQSLIRGAEIRAITADLLRYQSSALSFRDKYMALPGDMTNATSFWGAQHATPATCITTASTTAATCNGNGNGQIASSGTTDAYEQFRGWQQLANAGLIEGSYSGILITPDPAARVGTNIPAGRISNTGWGLIYLGALTGGVAFDGNYNHVFIFGAQHATAYFPSMPTLKAEEAWSIDTKLDDGKPGYGNVFTQKNTHRPNCVSTDVSSTAVYQLTDTTKGCDIWFKAGF